MLKCNPDYLSALSENDLKTVEDIVDYKYRKFMLMCTILKELGNNISSIKYNAETSNDILEVDVNIAGINMDYALKKVEKKVCKLRNPKEVHIRSGKKKLLIRIEKVETDV